MNGGDDFPSENCWSGCGTTKGFSTSMRSIFSRCMAMPGVTSSPLKARPHLMTDLDRVRILQNLGPLPESAARQHRKIVIDGAKHSRHANLRDPERYTLR